MFNRSPKLFRHLQRQLIVLTRTLRQRRPSELERSLSKAIDHADLERRMRQAQRVERYGLW
jgi:hypothetical protein